MTNRPKGVLYTGVTSNLVKRLWQHKEKVHGGFTAKYNLTKLIYYETYDDVREAILREKRIKKWKRSWKVELIEKSNPGWYDQAQNLTD